jgi:hypothetical protein
MPPKRLSTLGEDKSYVRPKKTYQDTLSAKQIEEKLKGYEKVDDISEVPINTHIRYFITDDNGKIKFRTGGFLLQKNNADTYVMLTDGKHIWSVQVNRNNNATVFFKKMSHKQEIDVITAHHEKKLRQQDITIRRLRRYIIYNEGDETYKQIIRGDIHKKK